MSDQQASSSISLFNKWKPVLALVVTFQLSLGGVVWGGAWFLAGKANEMDSMKNSINQIEEDSRKDRYTLTAASEKALRTAIENPGHRVVDPRDPSKIIVVKESP